MKIKLLAIGKTDDAYLVTGIEKFINRLGHYIPFEMAIIPDVKQGGKMTADKLKEEEGKLLLQKIQGGDMVVLLDEKGKLFSSPEFSVFLQKKMNAGISTLVFVIGGPFGFSTQVYERANDSLSLSKMTFSHQMVRLFFTEQLYRAFTIIKGEKYHHP